MQQLMSYLLWWRGTPRPLTGQDHTNWRMHSDGATLSQLLAQLLGHRWALTAPRATLLPRPRPPLHGSTWARVQCRIKLQRPLLLPATYVLAQLRRAMANCAAHRRRRCRHRRRRASVICPPDDLPTVKCCISHTNWITLWVRRPCYSSHQFRCLLSCALKYSGVVKMSQVGSS